MISDIIADENIPNSVVKRLREQGYNIIAIKEIERGLEDLKIVQMSNEKQSIIITLDKDFRYLTYHLKMRPFSVILIRIHPQSPDIIYEVILSVLKQIIKEKIDMANKFIVSDGVTLRIREI